MLGAVHVVDVDPLDDPPLDEPPLEEPVLPLEEPPLDDPPLDEPPLEDVDPPPLDPSSVGPGSVGVLSVAGLVVVDSTLQATSAAAAKVKMKRIGEAPFEEEELRARVRRRRELRYSRVREETPMRRLRDSRNRRDLARFAALVLSADLGARETSSASVRAA